MLLFLVVKLIDVFEEWVRHDVGRVYVQMFDVTLANFVGEPPHLCIYSETCGSAMAMEHTGDLFSCDHFVEPEYLIGNIDVVDMGDLVGSTRQTVNANLRDFEALAGEILEVWKAILARGAFVAVTLLRSLVRRGLVPALFHSVPLAVAFLSWWLLVGPDVIEDPYQRALDIGEVVGFVRTGYQATFDALAPTSLLAIGYALLLVMGEQLEEQPRFLRLFLWLIPLPYIANTAGWILTEFGRFPWIVYSLMKIADGVSITVPAWSVGLTLVGYTLIYAALMVATIYLLAKYARRGAGHQIPDEIADGDPAIALVGD